ncbi:MAG: HAMP domain-containing histidine kinase [Bacteroidetes bacterium]|nr:HAMP domain-containing histidine kinase [Bacteroidota bacterium]
MKKPRSHIYHITIFTIAQIFWFLLLGIWIYWFVTNYIILEQAGDQLSAQLNYEGFNLLPFVGGLILLVGISVGMSVMFRHLNVQLKLHKFYDNFIANVSHELKSPLSSIQLYLETLTARNVPPEKQQEFFQLMLKDSNRLNNLINTILEVSSLDRKSIAYDYHIVNAGNEIEKIVRESMKQLKLSEDILTFDCNIDALFVIDQKALKIVFDNLVNNAKKYSINELKIKVMITRTPKKIVIEFTDNGIGLPSGEQSKIFEKFYRIYTKEIPNVKGTGLGLYWAKEIIRSHGGNITASSPGKGLGTTFKIELPAYKAYKIRFVNKLLKRTREMGGSEN